MKDTADRKKEGRFQNMVRLNTPIYESQDNELNHICEITDKSKADVVRDAITLYINTMIKAGV